MPLATPVNHAHVRAHAAANHGIERRIVRMVNRMQQQLLGEQSVAPAQAPADIQLLTEIRDLLKARLPLAVDDSQVTVETQDGAVVRSLPH